MGIQVDLLTQDKTLQDYINFEFDGKYVSDFGLVVVSDGDRLNLAGSSDFEDEVQSINGVNGQYYWGTNFKSLKRDFTLATDGMTEAQLQAFKYHFRPGRYGKFIETHLPYRESYCRIAAVTNFSMVPFRKLTNVAHKGTTHSNLYVNEYKGEVKLTLEWDNPYTTSTVQYFTNEEYGSSASKFASIYPTVFANNIPLETELAKAFLVTSESTLDLSILGKMILGAEKGICDFHLGADKKLQCNFTGNTSTLVSEKEPDQGAEPISGLKIFYNPSTAPTSAKITFTITPTINVDDIEDTTTPLYFMDIADKYNLSTFITDTNSSPQPYNTIQMSAQKIAAMGDKFVEDDGTDIEKEFLYSSPNVVSSIHKAIDIGWKYFNKEEETIAILMEEELRQEISHDKVLKWAIAVLAEIRKNTKYGDTADDNKLKKDKTIFIPGINLSPLGYSNTNSDVAVNWAKYFNILMLLFFSGKRYEILKINLESRRNNDAGIPTSIWLDLEPIVITFDSENSMSYVTYYNCIDKFLSGSPLGLSKTKILDEPSGDMIYSGYLKLGGGDFIDEHAQIAACHYLKFLIAGQPVKNVDNISLEYKFTYL